ncbi:nitronate monooxygenase [Kitasatospora sp. NPDC001175]|uniref:nitronate monooxygenase n=1 Tax=Kitasatospora sp. NPDC001175 TaxID=3157103 RepID=UPI003D012895
MAVADVLRRLAVPVVAAPMAGGASAPALVASVNGAGGLGFLASGYLTARAMTEQIARLQDCRAVRERTRAELEGDILRQAGRG